MINLRKQSLGKTTASRQLSAVKQDQATTGQSGSNNKHDVQHITGNECSRPGAKREGHMSHPVLVNRCRKEAFA